MDIDQHQRSLTAVRSAASLFDWGAWVEPYFFAGASYRIAARDLVIDDPFFPELAGAIDAVRHIIAIPAAPEPAASVDAVEVLSPKLRETLEAIVARGGPMSLLELSVVLNAKRPAVGQRVKALVALGLVVGEGATTSRRYHAKSRGPAEQAPSATAAAAPGDLQPQAPPPATPEPVAPPLDPVSPRVRRAIVAEEADRARQHAVAAPRVDPVLRRRIALYFSAHGRTDTLTGLAGKLNLTGDAVRPTVQSMLEAGALEQVPGATPTRYRQPEALAA